MNGMEKFAALSPAEKIKHLEDAIMNQFDGSYQAFDLEELASCYPDDRLHCWNAAMNLVEQGRAHVIQVREKENPDNLRWIMVGFDCEILSNKKFHPPGQLIMDDNQKVSKAVEFKKVWKKYSSVADVAKALGMTVLSVREQVAFMRKNGFKFDIKEDEQIYVIPDSSGFMTPAPPKVSDLEFVTPPEVKSE